MTSRDLFEMASLDVMGLLDEQERVAFEEAFRAAPPAVQAQIRREQLRFAEVDRLLPDVEAPAGLRAKVLAAVRDAVSVLRTEPVGRIGAQPARAGFASSAPLWRAACLGFASASLVLSYTAFSLMQNNRQITDSALTLRIGDDMAKNAPGLPEVLLSPGFSHVSFTPLAQDAGGAANRATARLLIDTTHGKAYLVCDGLQIAAKYELVVVGSGSDRPERIREFEGTPGHLFLTVEGIDAERAAQLQIHARQGESGASKPILVADRA